MKIFSLLRARKIDLIVADLAAVFIAFSLAELLRFEGRIPSFYWNNFLRLAPYIMILYGAVGYLFGLYRGEWKYVSLYELKRIIMAALTSTFILLVIGYFTPSPRLIPLGVVLIGGALYLISGGGLRFGVRMIYERRRRLIFSRPARRVLIVGAGDAGEMITREMIREPQFGLSPIGFIDDNPSKKSLVIHGLKVLGDRNSIPEVVKNEKVDEVLIAIPSAGGEIITELVQICEQTLARLRILPNILEIMNGKVSLGDIREVQIEDLLGRELIETEIEQVAGYLTRKVVLVTGGAGSIGSELCQQILPFSPKQLLILDMDENLLYELDRQLENAHPGSPRQLIVGDIRDKGRMEQIFSQFRPEIIFHAAAHKQVPLMEYAPAEAVKTNVIGTRNVAEAAVKFGADKFILISTDKAVSPVSVMGATKRVAELMIKQFAGGRTIFAVVRFGNVLGSRGSVVPIFREQIKAGGPVTVTHPEASRFVMAISEAAQLVIYAGALAEGGEIFILDMGEPVNIMNLANKMITLSGLEPDLDIPIKIIGLRPGEKLEEELTFPFEKLTLSSHPKIILASSPPASREKLFKDIDELSRLVSGGDREKIIAKLVEIVPSYQAPEGVKVVWGERAIGKSSQEKSSSEK